MSAVSTISRRVPFCFRPVGVVLAVRGRGIADSRESSGGVATEVG